MAFQRGYQPNPWTSGAPPGQVMSGLMASSYQQPTGPQQHFAPNPAAYNLAAGNGIQWNMPNAQQLKMGQQTGWQQQPFVSGNQRGNQRTPNKRNANWNDGHQVKRQSKGPNVMNNSNSSNRNNSINKGNQNNRNNNNSNRGGNVRRSFGNRNNNQNSNQKKRNQNQNRGKQHHAVAQKAAENLAKKQYPIKKATNTDVKNEDFDSIQGHYVIGVFGYCCKLCDVFLKDKAARNEHVKEEDHLAKFKVAEEEKKAKKLAKTKAKTEQSGDEKVENGDKNEEANGDTSLNENVNEEEQNEDENVENEEEEEEQADDSNVAENGNEDQDTEDEAKVDSSEVTEESKNLQQSIQQDLSTEQTSPVKKVNTPKGKPFIKQANRGKGARGGAANRGRAGNRGKRQN